MSVTQRLDELSATRLTNGSFSAFCRHLFAQDQIDNARARKNAYEQQFRQNQHLFRQGEGTRTDILEAESRYELASAEEIQARDEQDATLRELGALMGVAAVNIDELTPLANSFTSLALEPASFSAWHALALERNPLLASQREAMEVARYEVERNRAGHLPKLNAYASVRHDLTPNVLQPAQRALLLRHTWPGNVRELMMTLATACPGSTSRFSRIDR